MSQSHSLQFSLKVVYFNASQTRYTYLLLAESVPRRFSFNQLTKIKIYIKAHCIYSIMLNIVSPLLNYWALFSRSFVLCICKAYLYNIMCRQFCSSLTFFYCLFSRNYTVDFIVIWIQKLKTFVYFQMCN